MVLLKPLLILVRIVEQLLFLLPKLTTLDNGHTVFSPLSTVLPLFSSFGDHLAGAMLVRWYDAYMYSPLQTALWPLVEKMPRSMTIRGRQRDVFTANIISWSRTLLVIPIALTLKFGYHWSGCCCVLLHDFLDHLDGIVAKVQRQKYGQIDDPVVGGFMDAFCDKIVNVLSLWSILLVTDFSTMSWSNITIYCLACSIIIIYEFTLGVVRVQDFFRAFYFREFKKTDVDSSKTSTAAIMEGKLKEKLEFAGIAALCVAQSNIRVLTSISGVLGVTCLFLSVRLAHSSLLSKLKVREPQIRSQVHASDDEDEMKSWSDKEAQDVGVQTDRTRQRAEKEKDEDCDSDWSYEKGSPVGDTRLEKKEMKSENCGLHRCFSMNESSSDDTRAERVYTVGCFDLFHHGHIQLLKQMRTFGKKVIVGVHDSRSIYQLKKRVPVDSTVTRMRNVKQLADEVFCVAGTDPTPFIENIFDKRNDKGSTIYVRGDDMPQFPARHLCEKLMTVKFLPYTEGVSSTKLRKNLFNSSHCDFIFNDGLGETMPY